MPLYNAIMRTEVAGRGRIPELPEMVRTGWPGRCDEWPMVMLMATLHSPDTGSHGKGFAGMEM